MFTRTGPAAGATVLSLFIASSAAASGSAVTLVDTAPGFTPAPSHAANALQETLPAPSLVVSPQDGATAAAVDADASPLAPEPQSLWDAWEGTVEGGINGSSGNSENFNLRGGVGAKRITPTMETKANLVYQYATDDGDTSQHRAEAELRNDWNFRGSPWGFFVLARAEYDEFTSYKYRTSLFLGPSYRLIDDETTKLKLRAGAGLTKEYGKQARNEIIPELDLGFDFEHAFTDRQKIFWTFDYFPSLADFSQFRIDTKAGYEIVIDPEARLSLKLGVNDRYNSEPGEGKKRNDLDYFVMIAWTF